MLKIVSAAYLRFIPSCATLLTSGLSKYAIVAPITNGVNMGWSTYINTINSPLTPPQNMDFSFKVIVHKILLVLHAITMCVFLLAIGDRCFTDFSLKPDEIDYTVQRIVTDVIEKYTSLANLYSESRGIGNLLMHTPGNTQQASLTTIMGNERLLETYLKYCFPAIRIAQFLQANLDKLDDDIYNAPANGVKKVLKEYDLLPPA